MKFYDTESVFTYGKYEGKTLAEVVAKDPKYIDFCYNNFDEFYISPAVMQELKEINPKISGPASDTLMDDDELDSFLDEIDEFEEVEEDDFDDDDYNWEEEDLDLLSDDELNDFDDGEDDF